MHCPVEFIENNGSHFVHVNPLVHSKQSFIHTLQLPV